MRNSNHENIEHGYVTFEIIEHGYVTAWNTMQLLTN
jgi:hypothetical protein